MIKFFFRDTTLAFRLVYFITAMMPSLLIFVVSNIKLIVPCIINLQKQSIFIIIIPLIILVLLIIYCILTIIFQSANCTMKIIHIIDVNDKTISLLTGIILPTVVSNTDNLCVNLLTYFGMLFVIYKLMMRSSNSFPNLFFILFGYDLYKCEANEKSMDISEHKDNIFILSKKGLQEGEEIAVFHIANSGIYLHRKE